MSMRGLLNVMEDRVLLSDTVPVARGYSLDKINEITNNASDNRDKFDEGISAHLGLPHRINTLEHYGLYVRKTLARTNSSLNESTTSHIESELFDKFEQRTSHAIASAKVGDFVSLLHLSTLEIPNHSLQAQLSGFLTPKEITKIDGSGDKMQVHFADGDIYPRQDRHTVFFMNQSWNMTRLFADYTTASDAYMMYGLEQNHQQNKYVKFKLQVDTSQSTEESIMKQKSGPAGQLKGTDKLSKNGARNKLVGASEGSEPKNMMAELDLHAKQQDMEWHLREQFGQFNHIDGYKNPLPTNRAQVGESILKRKLNLNEIECEFGKKIDTNVNIFGTNNWLFGTIMRESNNDNKLATQLVTNLSSIKAKLVEGEDIDDNDEFLTNIFNQFNSVKSTTAIRVGDEVSILSLEAMAATKTITLSGSIVPLVIHTVEKDFVIVEDGRYFPSKLTKFSSSWAKAKFFKDPRNAEKVITAIGMHLGSTSSQWKVIISVDSDMNEDTDGQDTVSVDIPLLIRLLEYAREDAKTDMDLHNVAEKMIALSDNGMLTMDNYADIVGGKSVDEGEGDPEGLPHITPKLVQNILQQIETEGPHAISKSIEWGDGAASELMGLLTGAMKEYVSSSPAEIDEACWKGYKQVGMKKKGGKQVPNCVPTEGVDEHIVKNGSKFELVSKKGKNLGKFSSHAAAAKHEGEVEYFKSHPKEGVAEGTTTQPLMLLKRKLTTEAEVITYVQKFRNDMRMEGLPSDAKKNDVKLISSSLVRPNAYTLKEGVDLNSARTKFVNRLSALDEFQSMNIKIGAKVSIINANIIGSYVELWGFIDPKTISKITTEGGKIKQFEFNGNPTDVFPRTDLATFNGEELMHSAFFKSPSVATQALSMLILSAPPELQIYNNIKSNTMKISEIATNREKTFGVKYKVFAGREGRITTKEYWCDSQEKLERAVAKIEALDNFYEIDGYSMPPEQQGVKEGYWQDALKKAEADREARKGKPFEKNPASHDKNGVYKGDKDLAGTPVPKHKEQSMSEAGPFNYGAKTPRKGTVAANAAQKRKEQDRRTPPIEPKDQQIGNAKVSETKSLAKRVRIVAGSEKGKTGTIGEIRHGAYKGAPKTYTIDIDGGGNIQLRKEALRLIKDETDNGVNEAVTKASNPWKGIGFDLRSDVLWPMHMFESTDATLSINDWISEYKTHLAIPKNNVNCMLAMVVNTGNEIKVFHGVVKYAGETPTGYILDTGSGPNEYSKKSQMVFSSMKEFAHFKTMLSTKFGDMGISIESMPVVEAMVDEAMFQPAQPTANISAKAPQQAPAAQNPAMAAQLKKQQTTMNSSLSSLKAAGVDVDPAKATQALQKAGTPGTAQSSIDSKATAPLTGALGKALGDPKLAPQLNTLLKQAGKI